jgi:hypothetical protein
MKSIRREDAANTAKRRRSAPGSLSPVPVDSVMDDTHIMDQNQDNKLNSVVFGAYSADEWITSTWLRDNIERGISTSIFEGTWIVPAGWSLAKWCRDSVSYAESYNFVSSNRALIFMKWGIIEIGISRSKLQLVINGSVDEVDAFVDFVDTQFKRAANLIEWVYSSRGESISVPMNYRAAIPEAYPWLQNDPNAYIDAYLNSDASVIILIGPPGTGKCLDPDEEIELLVSDEIFEKLMSNTAK